MRRAIAAAAAALGVAGCTPYTGINSLPLPGTEGTGSDSYQITVQLRNADDLVANTPVFVSDINVGTTTRVALDGWTPTLTVSLEGSVKLPANAVAALAQSSLLGSKHIDLGPPRGVAPQGTLAPGSVIKEDRVKQFPETEDLLSGLSLLLNGGGLQHVQTITTELNRALGNGRDADARELLTQLDNFTAGLDKQTADITYALQGLDHLGGTLAPRMAELDKALGQLPAGLETVSDLEPRIISTLGRLGDSTASLAPFADNGTQQLTKVLGELRSPLQHVGDIQPGSLPRALRYLPFVIFTLDSLPFLIRGDYANLNVPVNLTLDSLDKNLFTGTPLSGGLNSAARAARDLRPGSNAPPAPSPLTDPLGLPPAPRLPGPSGVAPRKPGDGPLPAVPKLGR